jgi:hypothetical protein
MSGDLFDDDIIPISTSISTAATASSTSYTSDQLQRLLKYEKQKVRILNSESAKPLASWWRSFGYPAVQIKKMNLNEFPVSLAV